VAETQHGFRKSTVLCVSVGSISCLSCLMARAYCYRQITLQLVNCPYLAANSMPYRGFRATSTMSTMTWVGVCLRGLPAHRDLASRSRRHRPQFRVTHVVRQDKDMLGLLVLRGWLGHTLLPPRRGQTCPRLVPFGREDPR